MPNALYNLGVYNEMGYGGLSADLDMAMDLYQRAANASSTSALSAIENLKIKIANSKQRKSSLLNRLKSIFTN